MTSTAPTGDTTTRGSGPAAPDDRLSLAALARGLWPFVRPYKRGFGICLGILLLSFGLELLGPYLIREAIDGPLRAIWSNDAPMGRSANDTSILGYGIAYLAVVLLGTGLGYAYALRTTWNGQCVVRDVRRALFSRLLRSGTRFHDEHATGRLVTRVTTDVENLNQLLATGVLQSLFDLAKVVGVLAVLFAMNATLALFTLIALPVAALVSVVFRRRAAAAYGAVRERLGAQNGYTAEILRGSRALAAWARRDAAVARYDEHNRATEAAWLRTVRVYAVFFAVVDFTVEAMLVGMVWIGGQQVLAGALDPGQFVQFWLYFRLIAMPVRQLGEKFGLIQAAAASATRIFRLLRVPPDPVDQGTRSRSTTTQDAASVSFDGVTFGYAPDRPVLRDFSLQVDAGTTVAIVGPTGAGKSTLVALLSRLFDPQQGKVLIDDTELSEYRLDEIRQMVGVVPQTLELVHGTLLDNLRRFDHTISESAVLSVLEDLDAQSLVQSLPQGLMTEVDTNTAPLSHGQLQLLACARALLLAPRVLVLDEATASLDSVAEASVLAALRKRRGEFTLFVVAHRLSTARSADRIVALRNGCIEDSGTPDELRSRGGPVAELIWGDLKPDH